MRAESMKRKGAALSYQYRGAKKGEAGSDRKRETSSRKSKKRKGVSIGNSDWPVDFSLASSANASSAAIIPDRALWMLEAGMASVIFYSVETGRCCIGDATCYFIVGLCS